MEENIKSNPDSKSDNNKKWYQSTKVIVAICTFVAIVGYFGFNQMRNNYLSKNAFETQQPSPAHNVKMEGSKQDIVAKLNKDSITANDTLPGSDADFNEPEGISDIKDVEVKKDSSSGNIFKVNTSYDKIEIESVSPDFAIDGVTKGLKISSLFEELLLPEEEQEKLKNTAFEKYYQQHIVAYKSVLKLLAIAGKQILLGNNTTDNQDIILALAESPAVEGICIVNRKNIVIYATNQKLFNSIIQESMPEIDVAKTSLSWYQNEGRNISSIPLYHTAGRVGTAVLITTQDAN